MKRFLATVLCIAMVLTAMPLTVVMAEDELPVTLVAGNAEAYPGNSVGVYVTLNNAVELGTLEMGVYYDSSVLTLNSVTKGSLVSSSSADINKDTLGEVRASFVNFSGISGSGNVLYLSFTINSDAPAGTYPISLSVGEASNISFEDIEITKTAGSITVKETEPQTIKTINFYSSFTTSGEVTLNSQVKYTLRAQNTYNLTGGKFYFEYDPDVLEYVGYSFASEMASITAVVDVNTKTKGLVKIAYSDIEAITDTTWVDLIYLNFKVIDDTAYQTSVVFKGYELMDVDLNSLNSNSPSSTLTIVEKKSDLKVTYDGNGNDDRTFTVDVTLTGESGVAAGDFWVDYDTSKMICTAATVNSAVAESGAMLVTKEKIDEGRVSFSYVNSSGCTENIKLLTLTFEPVHAVVGDTTITTGGKNVVKVENSNIVNISINYIPITFTMPYGAGGEEAAGHFWDDDYTVDTEPTCTTDGSKSIHCSGCTEVKDVTAIPKLGHDFTVEKVEEEYLKSAATADSPAIYYYACSRCGESAEGHDETKTFEYGERLKYTVTVTKGTSDQTENIFKGTTVTITADAAEKGYQFKEWTSTQNVAFASKTSATTTFSMLGENVEITATYECAPLNGTVTITGDAIYGKTLTATVTDTNNTGTLTYTWKVGDTVLSTGTENTYVVGEAAVNKAITCEVTSGKQTGSVSAVTGTVAKAANENKPAGLGSTATTKINGTDGTITGVDTTMEYQLKGADSWTKCTGTTITGLDAGTYYVRFSETTTHYASGYVEVTVAEHTHTFDQCKVDAKYLKSEATADSPAIYYKSCACGDFTTEETFTDGDKLKYTITIINGSVTVDSVAVTTPIYKGDIVTIKANDPSEGWEFVKWEVVSGNITFADDKQTEITFTMIDENVEVKATYQLAPLAGTVTIIGSAVYNQTLEAHIYGDNNTGTITYKWYVGDSSDAAGTGTTYVIKEADIGETIKCVVTSDKQTGSIYATTATVVKAPNTSKPSGLDSTPTKSIGGEDGTITGVTTTMEYRLSTDESWTKCEGTTVTGLDDGTYYVRFSETGTHFASDYVEVTVAEHTHTFDKCVVDAKYLKSAATADSPAIYYKSCACGEFTTAETFTDGDKIKYSVTVTNGTATVNYIEITAPIYKDDVVSIKANDPEKGWRFVKWEVVSGTVTFLSDSSLTTTFVMPGENVEIKATYEYSPLVGTVTVTGNAICNETLTASVSGDNNTGELSYNWYVGDSETSVSTNTTYTIQADDVGKTIKCVVTSNNQTGSIASAATETVIKASNGATPSGLSSTPTTTMTKNDGTITGVNATMEYKLSTDDSWTTCTGTEVTDLAAGTYNVRFAETPTYYASESVDVIVNKHIHVFDKMVVDAKYLKNAADCTHDAEYYYSCDCGEYDASTSFGNPASVLGHDFTKQIVDAKYLKSAATADSPAVYYYACSRCDESAKGHDETKTYEYGEKLRFNVTVTNGTVETVVPAFMNTVINIKADDPAKGYKFKEWNVVSGDITLLSTTSATTSFTMGDEDVVLEAIYELAPLTGTVTITGDAVYGETLTASISGDNNTGDLTYTWYVGSTEVGKGTTYTVGAEAVEKTITCKVTSDKQSGECSATTATVERAENLNTVTGLSSTVTTKIGATDGTITGVDTTMEYQLKGADTWTSCNGTTIEGLDDGEYLVRYKATTTHKASAATEIAVAEHAHIFDKEVVDAKYLKSEATADDPAEYYKSCACGESSKGITDETFKYGERLKYAVTITDGTATPNKDIFKGKEVTLKANDAASGYEFDKWVVTDDVVTVTDNKFTMPGQNVEVKATYKFATLSGTVLIVGTGAYGETLTANVYGSNSTLADFTYTWKCGDQVLGTGKTYTIVKSDINTVITCEVTTPGAQTGTISASTDTITKATAAAPDYKTISYTNASADGVADGSLTGLTTAMEYRLEGDENWTKCEGTTVSGLIAGSYYIRYAETETHFASEAIEQTIGNHTHVFNKKVTTSTYLKSAATCTSAAVYYYSCECGECGTATFTSGSALGHKWNSGKVTTQPGRFTTGVKTYTCSRCGTKKTESIPALTTTANNNLFAGGVTSTRYYGDTRYKTCLATAEALKTALGVSKFDNIVVVAGFNFPDALSATYLAAQLNAPIIMVDTQYSTSDASGNINYVIKNFSKSGKIYLIGGNVAISSSVESTLKNKFSSSKVERIYGQDRYETNAKVLQRTKELGLLKSYDLLVCSGAAFPDALSCSGLGKPIMLVDGTNAILSSTQKSFVSKASKVYLIGGTVAVSSGFEGLIKSCGKTATRLSGNDRYETSQKIANYFCSSSKSVVIASGLGFADGLCGGSLAYALGAPVVLTCNATVDGWDNTNYTRAKSVVGSKKVVILGGSASLDNSTAKKIKSATIKEHKYN